MPWLCTTHYDRDRDLAKLFQALVTMTRKNSIWRIKNNQMEGLLSLSCCDAHKSNVFKRLDAIRSAIENIRFIPNDTGGAEKFLSENFSLVKYIGTCNEAHVMGNKSSTPRKQFRFTANCNL